MALNMTPKVFGGLVEQLLDDAAAEMFVDLAKLILKADGETNMTEVLVLLDEAKNNFTANYDLVRTKLEQV